MRLWIGLLAAVIMAAGIGGAPALADSAYQAFGTKGRPQDVRRTIDIVMRDNRYQPQRIQVRTGETIRFRVRNDGEFLHEFNIGTAAMHQQHQREMQAMFESGMMSAASKDAIVGMDHSKMPGMNHGAVRHDDPNAVLVDPGKTEEMIFKFTKAANLEFACNIPGHYESGMVGNVTFSR
ncbi:cupredoxin family protein [Roseomonas sp. E05]|uniref:cupredoxin domain-containing protein n=1 Tax=Roseomonas sp. E05 TaxID=3046310 RepID=UPI0024BA8E7D|nr:cupredoxin family protein [Roseomonas sp. E05]MDJ0391634.1 cupredoxin family protein [Roseomonas sp. E05]